MTALERAESALRVEVERQVQANGSYSGPSNGNPNYVDAELDYGLLARAVLMAVLSDMQRYEPDGDGYGWFGMSKDDHGDYIDISGIWDELKDTTYD